MDEPRAPDRWEDDQQLSPTGGCLICLGTVIAIAAVAFAVACFWP